MCKGPGAGQSTAFRDLEEVCVPGARVCVEGDKAEDHSTQTGFLTVLKHLNVILRVPWELLKDLVGGSDMYNIDSAKEGTPQQRMCGSRPCHRRWGGVRQWVLGPWLLLSESSFPWDGNRTHTLSFSCTATR